MVAAKWVWEVAEVAAVAAVVDGSGGCENSGGIG